MAFAISILQVFFCYFISFISVFCGSRVCLLISIILPSVSSRPNSTQNQLPCSGRGECVCGKCETCDCLPGSVDKDNCRRYTGDYCQCNPDNCPRNSKGVICSGPG